MPAKRPTILQIIPELDTGGAELSTAEIAEAIVDAGGRAIVLSEGGRIAPRITACGGEFVPFPAATKNPVRMLWNSHAISKIIAENDVDLVHARSRAPAWSARAAARKHGKAFVTTYHGAYNENGPIKRYYNSIMANGDAVIANSTFTRDLIRQRYQTPLEKIRVIHRGVDGNDFNPAAVSAGRTRALFEKWGLKENERVILQAARLTGWKGQRVLIEAARLLKKRGALENTRVVLAGDSQGRDGYRAELENQISNADLAGHVLIAGHVDDIAAALLLAHVTVIASTEPEAFGRTAAEAQAMGCPVIATALGAPQETVLSEPRAKANEMTGWLVPPGDAEALASAIQASLDQSTLERAALAGRARRHILENFSLAAMRQATLEVYDSLLGTRLAEARADRRPGHIL